MKVTAIYFSPTDNTKKSVLAMTPAVGDKLEEIDVTVPGKNDAPRKFSADEFVIIGGPVYGGRIPVAAMERLDKFTGTGTPCILVATYGNRHYDDALVELKDFAESRGFVVRGAAALVGRHTYGEIQVDRPNKDDLDADYAFAVKAAANTAEVQIPGNRPYKDGGKGGSFRPLTTADCIECGLCRDNCTMGAIAEDCKTVSDSCISCFRCIRICPFSAKNMDVEAYNTFAAAFSERLSARRENEYFI